MGLGEVASVYDIRTFRSFWFLLRAKPGRIPLVEDFNEEDSLWEERYFFVKQSTIPNGENLPMEWVQEGTVYLLFICMFVLFDFDFLYFVVPKFGVIAPVSSDSKLKVKRFFALPVVDRIFKLEHVIFPGSSSRSDSSDGKFPENII